MNLTLSGRLLTSRMPKIDIVPAPWATTINFSVRVVTNNVTFLSIFVALYERARSEQVVSGLYYGRALPADWYLPVATLTICQGVGGHGLTGKNTLLWMGRSFPTVSEGSQLERVAKLFSWIIAVIYFISSVTSEDAI